MGAAGAARTLFRRREFADAALATELIQHGLEGLAVNMKAQGQVKHGDNAVTFNVALDIAQHLTYPLLLSVF